jgi:hypothetical protein
MDENAQDKPDPPTELPVVGERASVPVFDCHVIVSLADERGGVTARMTRLPTIIGSGPTEREALQKLVAAFKAAAQGYLSRGEEIPWTDEALVPDEGESERWIPVHL